VVCWVCCVLSEGACPPLYRSEWEGTQGQGHWTHAHTVLPSINTVGTMKLGPRGDRGGAAAHLACTCQGQLPSSPSSSNSSFLSPIAMWHGGLGLVWLWAGLLLLSPLIHFFRKVHSCSSFACFCPYFCIIDNSWVQLSHPFLRTKIGCIKDSCAP
jgi:hypothetical protein